MSITRPRQRPVMARPVASTSSDFLVKSVSGRGMADRYANLSRRGLDPNAPARRSRKALRKFIAGRGFRCRRWRELALISADRAWMQTCAAEVHGLRLAPECLDEFGKPCK